jgi:hypothetical protein
MAVAIGAIIQSFKTPVFPVWRILFLSVVIISIFGLFYLENIKNGIAYGAIFLFIAIVAILRNRKHHLGFLKSTLLILFVAILSMFIVKNVEKNDSWRSFYYDLKLAVHEDPFDPTGYVLTGEFPVNEKGNPVQPANYARFTWGIAGLHLLQERPLGYGLVLGSFGHLLQERYPASSLNQSHSGWLDLALGIGVPGVLLMLIAAVMAIKNSKYLTEPWHNFGTLFLGGMILLLLTTEV